MAPWQVLAVLRDGRTATNDPRAAVEASSPVSPESVLVYVYTGGTTKASKCVTVTHAMALWEAENYPSALAGSGAGPADRMLQYSSLFWGAAVFGQLSLGLAFGACVCIGGCGLSPSSSLSSSPLGQDSPKAPSPPKGAGDALRQLATDVETFRVTFLGVVPSQLRGAWPGGPKTRPRSLRALVLWADKCPPELSRCWRDAGMHVADLLLASEYWLALHSDGCPAWNDSGVEKHVYRPLSSLDAVFLVPAEGAADGALFRKAEIGEVGEMYLTGPTVSPGYVCPDGRVSLEHFGSMIRFEGRAYLRTRDQLRLLSADGEAGGGVQLVYAGRADSLLKHGGQWVDAEALQDAVAAVPGVVQAALLSGEQGLDAFVVLHSAVLEGGAGGDSAEGEEGGRPAKRPCVRGSGEGAVNGNGNGEVPNANFDNLENASLLVALAASRREAGLLDDEEETVAEGPNAHLDNLENASLLVAVAANRREAGLLDDEEEAGAEGAEEAGGCAEAEAEAAAAAAADPELAAAFAEAVATPAAGSSGAPRAFRVLAAVRRALPGGCRVHLCTSLPLHDATAKVDRRALAARLQALLEARRSHCDDQSQLEAAAAQHYTAWGRAAVGLTCAPQLLLGACAGGLTSVLLGLSDLASLGGAGAGASATAFGLARLCGLCAARLVVLPELWAACTYLEERHVLPGSSLLKLLGRVPLPTRAWPRWLPLLSAALLPTPVLGAATAAACSYLGWVRERDARLALGFGSVASLLAARNLLPAALAASAGHLAFEAASNLTNIAGLTGPGGSMSSLGLGASTAVGIGALTVAMSPQAWELVSFLLAAPGLCSQILPKFLSDDFGYYVEKLLQERTEETPMGWFEGWIQKLRPPKWENTLKWISDIAVVDQGNRWDQVVLEGQRGEKYWNSPGLTVRLHPSLADDPLISSCIAEAEGRSGGGVVQGSPRAGGSSGDAPPAGQGEGGASPSSLGASGPLASLLERVCGGRAAADALHGMDSLQAIQMAEAIRREFGKPLSVADVLRCSELSELLAAVEKAEPEAQSAQKVFEHSRYHRVWLCGLGARMCTVDWMVGRQDNTQHLNVPALQRAVDRLVSRHAALRARNANEKAVFDATYNAASMWQLWSSDGAKSRASSSSADVGSGSGSGTSWTHSCLGHMASTSIHRAWPRTEVLLPGDPATAVRLLRPRVSDVLLDSTWGGTISDEQRAFWAGGALLPKRPDAAAPGTAAPEPQLPQQMFHVCVIPLFDSPMEDEVPEEDAIVAALRRPAAEVRWYIYVVLDHGYCDGPTGLPIFADLLRLYALEAEEANDGAAGSASADPSGGGESEAALRTLEQRLLKSLQPLPEAASDPNDDIFHDGLLGIGWRAGFQRFIRCEASLMRLLRYAATEQLGCSVDVAWLTAISAAFLRNFPDLRRLDLYLIVTCRDKPAEESMVGYFSSRKILAIELGDPRTVPILGLSDLISTARRQRSWQRPRPFEKFGAIEVNVVSQVADGLPHGFREVRYAKNAPSAWDKGGTSNMTIRLDQTDRDGWDFRMQSHDASFGQNWSTFFAQALGSVLVDMAVRPTGPVVPRGAEG
ncbi:unnamed protein product [Polarella glacialis]|uniref:Carrier domain-containing protein n=1 Tax=Polarella glacialis TaxID=89957 RepID=A0A813KG81_POLGL|nr:unnamed protein product [Polarella glacialis]